MSGSQPVALNASHLHECAVCEVTLICVCGDKRQVDRLTGKPRRLLCVTCGDIERGMRELDAQRRPPGSHSRKGCGSTR